MNETIGDTLADATEHSDPVSVSPLFSVAWKNGSVCGGSVASVDSFKFVSWIVRMRLSLFFCRQFVSHLSNLEKYLLKVKEMHVCQAA